MLPLAVKQRLQKEILNWNDTGMAAYELPHRGELFQTIANTSVQNVRDLLKVPDNYHVLFLHGGAQSQFSMVPLNLIGDRKKVAYVDTGQWSRIAAKEAERYASLHWAASAKANDYTDIPDVADWDVPQDAAYLHYVDNETIDGLEFSNIPQVDDLPLVCDMSSNIFSRAFDVSRFGLIYACAQKNLGCAGLTLVIIRDDLLNRQKAHPLTPKLFNYRLHVDAQSVLNTPSTMTWYICSLVLQWLKEEGGLKTMEARSQKKSELLYTAIDSSALYVNCVKPQFRSRMNVVFNLKDESLTQTFLDQAAAAGLMHLKGHKLRGGIRASIYNSMPVEGVNRLIAFMSDFEAQH